MADKSRKKRRIWIVVLVIALLLTSVASIGMILLVRQRANPLANVHQVQAANGSIEKNVTGTGSVSLDEETGEIPVVNGLMVDEVLVGPGDQVQAGSLLATFDPQSLQAAIWDKQAQLNNLDAQLNQLKGKTETQYVRTSVSGRVKQIFAAAGDTVQAVIARNRALLVLSLDGKMQVAFEPAGAEGLAAGDSVDVSLAGGDPVEGTIRSISAAQCVVTISDQTAAVGAEAKISKDGRILGAGPLAISQPLAITATDGVVGSILVQLNDKVGSGAKLVKLETAPVSQTYLKLYAQRADLADQLAALLAYAQNGGLTAAGPGEILAMNLVSGQTTGAAAAGAVSASGRMTAATVRTGADTQLAVQIDELDIAALTPGQTVQITLDALPGLQLSGSILKIAENGTVGQNGSTFSVTIDLPENPALKVGMSATAVITVDKRENIVKIPLEALQESDGETYVYVGKAVSSEQLGEKRLVTVGISDGEFVEIKTGLSAGETVNYYYVTSSSSQSPFSGGGFNRTNSSTTTAASD